jgi:hypothetical protein
MSIIEKLGITPGPWDFRIIRGVYDSEYSIRIPTDDKHQLVMEYAPEMLEALLKSIRQHYYCEDTWYSCPKAPEGCANDDDGDECTCGANDWNNYVIGIIEKATGKTWEEIKQLIERERNTI